MVYGNCMPIFLLLSFYSFLISIDSRLNVVSFHILSCCIYYLRRMRNYYIFFFSKIANNNGSILLLCCVHMCTNVTRRHCKIYYCHNNHHNKRNIKKVFVLFFTRGCGFWLVRTKKEQSNGEVNLRNKWTESVPIDLSKKEDSMKFWEFLCFIKSSW